MNRPFVVCLALATAIGLILPFTFSAERSASAASSKVEGSCPVTIPPKREAPPGSGFGRARFNYGNARVRAQLYWPHGVLIAGRLPDGGSMGTVNRDGSIYAKLGWWRGVSGQLVVTGHRIDAPAPPLRATRHHGEYGDRGFVPSGLTFPTVGCWRVVGTVGRATLSFVVQVTKPPDGVVTDCSTSSQATFPRAFSDRRNLVIGPFVLVGGAYTPASVVRQFGGEKFPALVRNGHYVTVELSRRTREFAGLAYGPLPQGDVHLRGHPPHRLLRRLHARRAIGEHRRRRPCHLLVGVRLGQFASMRAASRMGGRRAKATPRRTPSRRPQMRPLAVAEFVAELGMSSPRASE